MIGLSVLVLLLGFDGTIGRLDGALLFGGVVAYTVFAIRQSRKETQAVRAVYEQQFASGPNRLNMKQTALQVVLIVVGLALLVQGANWLVNGAVTLARLFRVSELVIGLTIVAVGTSLPEIATSILATIREERDIAVGNVVGSNIFNILAVLGISALVAPAGLAVSPAALRFDIPVMIAVAVVCLPIFFTGGLIARWEGLLFVGYYAAYTLFLIISAGAPQSMISFERVMIWAALPLTILVLLGSVGRSLWAARSGVVLESSPETLSDSHLSGQ
jgi:cation:H+ antiporter